MLIGVVFEFVLVGDGVRRDARPVTVLRWGKGHLHTSHGSLTPGNGVDTWLERNNKRVIILWQNPLPVWVLREEAQVRRGKRS
jgi:hypothetical protein